LPEIALPEVDRLAHMAVRVDHDVVRAANETSGVDTVHRSFESERPTRTLDDELRFHDPSSTGSGGRATLRAWPTTGAQRSRRSARGADSRRSTAAATQWRRSTRRGRLAIRERIDALLDAQSFREQGRDRRRQRARTGRGAARVHAANYVLGTGRIDGRPVRGGRRGLHAARRLAVAGRTAQERVRGGSVPAAARSAGAAAARRGRQRDRVGRQEPEAQWRRGDRLGPHRFASIAEAMASVPVASAALGAVAGLPARASSRRTSR
jgi:acetyl-CoA carboxylase carboxyltransferase component